MLKCSGCKEMKPESCFNRNNNIKRGYQTYCKNCKAKHSLKIYHKKLSNCPIHKAKKAEYDKERRKTKAEQIRAYDRERSNTPKRRAAQAEWTRRRRAICAQQTPAWADLKKIQSVYDSAKVLSERFGVTYHVDHIIPLRGKDICGLHVENNLQLLEAGLNVAKGNGRKTHFELPRRYYA
jgi:hypothetical protein